MRGEDFGRNEKSEARKGYVIAIKMLECEARAAKGKGKEGGKGGENIKPARINIASFLYRRVVCSDERRLRALIDRQCFDLLGVQLDVARRPAKCHAILADVVGSREVVHDPARAADAHVPDHRTEPRDGRQRRPCNAKRQAVPLEVERRGGGGGRHVVIRRLRVMLR